MAPEGLEGIMAAGRLESAPVGQIRRQRQLIKPNERPNKLHQVKLNHGKYPAFRANFSYEEFKLSYFIHRPLSAFKGGFCGRRPKYTIFHFHPLSV